MGCVGRRCAARVRLKLLEERADPTRPKLRDALAWLTVAASPVWPVTGTGHRTETPGYVDAWPNSGLSRLWNTPRDGAFPPCGGVRIGIDSDSNAGAAAPG